MAGSIKILVNNSKARYNYFLEGFLECGIELKGSEIKSMRKNGASLRDSYVIFRNGEAYILNMHISPYEQGADFNHEVTRTRKLLMHKTEIFKMEQKAKEKAMTIVPTKVYLKDGKCKIEIALAKGKKLYDKRATMKLKDDKRAMDKAKKGFNRNDI